eukprot:TRINITY_DN1065_c0_g1_i1.p1 TRINITY_DN1065_c0_g1~~TRINITY_DN1065_c0_g1_i1.p1  ORF type:complete len:300 (-),score=77.81 TRINITY_DN1065_c0_g1_i1:27-926(-)
MRLSLVFIVFSIFFSCCFGYDCTPTLDGKKYDFTALARDSDYLITKEDSGKNWDIYLNFCRATSETQYCTDPDTAICQVWDYNCVEKGCGAGSLGSVKEVAYSLVNGDVVYSYKGGKDDRNSTIRFICSPGTGVGFPKFVSEDPLKEYNFEWPTQYACPPNPSSCTFTLSNRQISLSTLRSSTDFYIAPDYSINICGSLINRCISNVTDSIACQRFPNTELSLGSSSQYSYSFDSHLSSLNITYVGGDAGRKTNFVVLCSKNYEEPFFLNESPVKVYNFIWRNPLVCNSTSFVDSFLNK